MATLKAGVVGAGVFGGFHAGKYAGDPRVELIGVFDADPGRCAALATKQNARAFPSVDPLFDACDVVTIATPASTHGPIVLAALKAGLHVLVEKPVATTLADADAVVAQAKSSGLVLQVGHQERFVFQAMGLLDVDERPLRISARRMGAFSERGSDVSVTLDLMTHDLDLVRRLAGGVEATRVEADVTSERTPFVDRARAEITFANGTVAVLEASRLHHERDRKMRVEYESGVVDVDFVAKTFSNTTPHALDPHFADTPSAKDSLGAGVAAFISAVLGDAPAPITGEDGREALRLALRVDAAL